MFCLIIQISPKIKSKLWHSLKKMHGKSSTYVTYRWTEQVFPCYFIDFRSSIDNFLTRHFRSILEENPSNVVSLQSLATEFTMYVDKRSLTGWSIDVRSIVGQERNFYHHYMPPLYIQNNACFHKSIQKPSYRNYQISWWNCQDTNFQSQISTIDKLNRYFPPHFTDSQSSIQGFWTRHFQWALDEISFYTVSFRSLAIELLLVVDERF